MSDIIRLLPDSVANQIAAGEVIQRPASVIKELVENAVDAGANSITIIVKGAGRTLIQVVDNGKGMTDTDARMAFERHATSKIVKADDLFNLNTMGFRGEALASIAAVAQIDMRTLAKGCSIGTQIKINGSKVESQSPTSCAQGTNMMIKNLFFNVPARRKFLKSDPVELSALMREFERLALVNPNVEFKLINEETTLHHMLSGSFKQRILDLFGKNTDKQLLPLYTKTPAVELSGFVGRPDSARKRNAHQYMMVNGRHMKHPYFHKAITMCYENLLAAGLHPNYFINFTVDPKTIDVNIHPTKNEIKFENENTIWQILNAAVRESLGRFNVGPTMDFSTEDLPSIPVFNPDTHAEHSIDIDTSYNPFNNNATSPKHPSTPKKDKNSSINLNWESLYDNFMTDRHANPAEYPTLPDIASNKMKTVEATLIPADTDSVVNRYPIKEYADETANSIQVNNRYILCPSPTGVIIIDQHRAHIKILFEQIMADLSTDTHSIPAQRVMFPEPLTLSSAQSVTLDELISKISTYGFEISCLGNMTYSILAHPAILTGKEPKEALLQMIEQTCSGNSSDRPWGEKMALALAKSAAIKKSQHLSASEREHLISRLLSLPEPKYTPEGQIIIAVLPTESIKSLF